MAMKNSRLLSLSGKTADYLACTVFQIPKSIYLNHGTEYQPTIPGIKLSITISQDRSQSRKFISAMMEPYLLFLYNLIQPLLDDTLEGYQAVVAQRILIWIEDLLLRQTLQGGIPTVAVGGTWIPRPLIAGTAVATAKQSTIKWLLLKNNFIKMISI